MERETNQTQQPSLCRTGCGFYGNSAFDGLCSKCFKDALRRKQQSPSPTQVGSTSQGAAVTLLGSTSSEDGNSSTAAPVPVIEAAAAAYEPSTSVSNSADDDDSRNLEAATGTVETKDKPKPKKNRCFMCRKKVGLTGFECRCGNLYCGLHRYSDKHDCTFDYKAEGRAAISKANPVVVGSKIQKI